MTIGAIFQLSAIFGAIDVRCLRSLHSFLIGTKLRWTNNSKHRAHFPTCADFSFFPLHLDDLTLFVSLTNLKLLQKYVGNCPTLVPVISIERVVVRPVLINLIESICAVPFDRFELPQTNPRIRLLGYTA